MAEDPKSKIRIFLQNSWFIPTLISFEIFNSHQLSSGMSDIRI